MKKIIKDVVLTIIIFGAIICFADAKFNKDKEILITPLEVTSNSEFIFYTNQPEMLYADKEKAIFYLNGNVYTYSFTDLKVIDAYTIIWEPTGEFNGAFPNSFCDKTGKYIYSKMMTFPDMVFKGAFVYNTETKKAEKISEEEITSFYNERFLISYDDPAIDSIKEIDIIARINEKEYVYVDAVINPGTITYVNGDTKTTYNIFENN